MKTIAEIKKDITDYYIETDTGDFVLDDLKELKAHLEDVIYNAEEYYNGSESSYEESSYED